MQWPGKHMFSGKEQVWLNKTDFSSWVCTSLATWPWAHQLTIFSLNSHNEDLSWIYWNQRKCERENLACSKFPIPSHYGYNSVNDSPDRLCVRLDPVADAPHRDHVLRTLSFSRTLHFLPSCMDKLSHAEGENEGTPEKTPILRGAHF